MVLIFSQEMDSTCNKLISLLLSEGIEFLRVNDSHPIKVVNITYESNNQFDLQFEYLSELYWLSNFKVCWLRRFPPLLDLGYFSAENISDKILAKEINHLLMYDAETIEQNFYQLISQKKCIGNPLESRETTIKDLILFQQAGGKIPRTMLTTKKDDLLSFNNRSKLICKKLNYHLGYEREGKYFKEYTYRVTPEIIEQMPDMFSPTFFQEEISKEYEIRSVVICDTIFSMAIFSQNDKKTELDFRNYNSNKPNRTVPYTLPNEIENQILKFMESKKTNFGSIDLIKSTDGDYVFLEINPVGQYDMVSEPCNYQIEKEIFQVIKTFIKNENINSN